MGKKKQEDVKLVEEVQEEQVQVQEESEKLLDQQSKEQVAKTIRVRFDNDVMLGKRYVGNITHELSVKDFERLARTDFKYKVV